MDEQSSKEKLLKRVEEVERWVRKNLENNHPDLAGRVSIEILALRLVVELGSEKEARAALHGADMIWYMLFEDAWSGYGTRGGRKDRTKVTVGEVVQEWNKLHEQNPEIGKTEAVKKIKEKLNKPDRTCSKSTVWKKLKKAGI